MSWPVRTEESERENLVTLKGGGGGRSDKLSDTRGGRRGKDSRARSILDIEEKRLHANLPDLATHVFSVRPTPKLPLKVLKHLVVKFSGVLFRRLHPIVCILLLRLSRSDGPQANESILGARGKEELVRGGRGWREVERPDPVDVTLKCKSIRELSGSERVSVDLNLAVRQGEGEERD